ncbi:MAG TPA: MMPL family transporter [Solirubrobacteraceae bacterium]|nr:MMPL family transporter [Solirubrobacteraceae bacterium]
MYASVARVASRRPRQLAAIGLVLLIACGAFGGPATTLLNANNGFQDPSSPSARSLATLQRATGAEPSAGVLALVPAAPASPQVTRTRQLIASVPGVAGVLAPPAHGGSPLVSRDRRMSLLAVSLRGSATAKTVVDAITARIPRDVRLGGPDTASLQVSSQASKDLGFAELLAFPLLALLGFLLFRGVAALLPLAVGGLSVLGAFSVLRVINTQLALSSFALNLVIGVGLGLAVDYSLLMVWRFREELSRGADRDTALATTLATAGRTVTFSSVTVAAALLTLALFPQRFLISMGIGGAAVALVAGLCSILLLPALLILLAPRIGRVTPEAEGTGRWYRIARAVMRRPIVVALGTSALLLAVASPTLHVRWSGVDATILPTSQSARVVQDIVARDFPGNDLGSVLIAVHAPPSDAAPVGAYAAKLRGLPGITSVASPRYLGSGIWELQAAQAGDPIGAMAQRTIAAVERLPAPFQADVGGPAAQFHDQRVAITESLPLALGVLAFVTLAILWLMTGSVVLPLKALLMNVLTTATATGVLVLIFQAGRLTGPLAYTSQGGIEQTDFLVLAAVAFALSTDYGVLLLTRIKEARDAGRSNREAVAVGLQRTGRIVSASAILMAVAIGAFATSKVVFLKEIGLGAVVAVLVDAFIVRTALVPSLMALLGEANWWSPRPLRALHRLIGVSEGASSPASPRSPLAPGPAKVVSLSSGE